jgi:hypothetical protein
MQRYQNNTPTAASAIAAVLMSSTVLAAGVYLPAKSAERTLADAQRIEVSIEPATIHVVGVRTVRTTLDAHVSEARAPRA